MSHGSTASHRRFQTAAALVLLLFALAGPLWAQPWSAKPAQLHQLLVLLAPPSGQGPSPATVVRGIAEGEGLDPGFFTGEPYRASILVGEDSSGRTWLENSARARMSRYVLLEYPDTTDLDAVVIALQRIPGIEYVEKDLLVHRSSAPDDDYYGDQYGHTLMNVLNAWGGITGHANVGLVDQGVYPTHPDLRPFSNYAVAGSTCYHSGLTFEGGNFRAQHSQYFDQTPLGDTCDVTERGTRRGHGTHVAGIVGATTDNSLGVAGACPGCNLMLGMWDRAHTESAALSSTARALTFLVDHGVQVVSMSFGYPAGSFSCPGTGNLALVCLAIEYAADRDVVMVASAGNDLTALVDFPASDARVWSIGGVEEDGDFWDFSNDPEECPCDRNGAPDDPGDEGYAACNAVATFECGSNWGGNTADQAGSQDLVAPAVAVVSTLVPSYDWVDLDWLNACGNGIGSYANGYGPCTGTSMSAPYVAGVVGLVRSVNPLLTSAQIRDAMVENASLANAFDDQFGYGIPDAQASAAAVFGLTGGEEVKNRLTPLFRLYSTSATAHLFTTAPQVAAAMIDGGLAYRPYLASPAQAPLIGGYDELPGELCIGNSCGSFVPRASVFLFASDRAPWAGAPALAPLYRLSKNGSWDEAFFYGTTTAEVQAKGSATYQVDGIEGYVFKKPEVGSVCTVPGTVKLIRLYKSADDDYVVIPDSEESAYRTASYDSVVGLSDWIGCVYPNVDSDGDDVIDGFEDVAGTNPLDTDSDCDSDTDGEELLEYDSNGYGDPLAGSCVELNRHIFDSFATGSAVSGRTTETGGVTWTATSAAQVSGAKLIDQPAIGTVPFDPTLSPAARPLEVFLDIDPTSSEWIAVGYTSSATASFATAGELWIQVKSAGTYAVFVGTTQVASGSLPGSPVGGFHNASVYYKQSTLEVKATINGVQVYSATLGAALTGIQHAGFQFFKSAGGGGKIDNFTITVNTNIAVQDTFTGSGQVNGRTTTTGSLAWTSGPALVSAGIVVDPDAIGGVPFDPTDLPGNPTVVVQGDINPVNSSWGGLGFSSQAAGAYWDYGQIWALVRSNGNYSVFVLGSQVASGAIPGSPVGGFSTIRVQYRPATQDTVVKINGVQVYSGTLGSAPTIDYAGFHFFVGADGSGGLDNFEVLATTAP